MIKLRQVAYLIATAGLLLTAARAGSPAPIVKANQAADLSWSVEGDGRSELVAHAENHSPAPATKTVTAGELFRAKDGEQMVALRTAEIAVPGGKSVDVQIPAAALSVKNAPTAFLPYSALPAPIDARLQPLLAYLSTRTDVPRATSQLALLALLEDIDFAQWQSFCTAAAQRPATTAPQPASPAPPSPEAEAIFQAIDALGILKQIAPAQSFTLLKDAHLKLRALRTPACRGKAMQIYGLTVETEGGGVAGVPVEIGQLLHTKAGDNCPICRMRQQMEGAANNF